MQKNIWNEIYKDTENFAEYVIGGPTLKLFVVCLSENVALEQVGEGENITYDLKLN